MSIRNTLIVLIPDPLKHVLRHIKAIFVSKNKAELSFWKRKVKADHGKFENSHYKKVMLGMAEESSDSFIKGKVIADFGCGPRGSLVWASAALSRIGIDVLADSYADEFTDNITSHGMIYLKSTEYVIPLPSDFVDIMFTLNALDHVDNFSDMCNEIIRVLKPGGEFIGSFNLEEPASLCEPQQLNEKIIQENLLNSLEIQSYRISKKGPIGNIYSSFFIFLFSISVCAINKSSGVSISKESSSDMIYFFMRSNWEGCFFFKLLAFMI